jgi:hypothetical protein
MLWRSQLRMPLKIAFSFTIPILTLLLPTWDVLITSKQMAALCQSEGLHITRTVAAEGLLTNFGTPRWFIDSGFQYVERQYSGRVEIHTKKNGTVTKEEVRTMQSGYAPRSRYEFHWGEPMPLPGYRNITRTRSYAKDRLTGEELGNAVTYSAYPGWLDSLTFQQLQRFVWQCPKRSGFPRAELLEKTIRPL